MDTILSQSRLVVRVGQRSCRASLLKSDPRSACCRLRVCVKRIAEDLGVIVPAVLFRDDATLAQGAMGHGVG